MAVPPRFQANGITRDIIVPEIVGHLLDFFRTPLAVAAVKHAQSPFRNHRAAAGKQIVLADDFRDGIALKHIDVDALSRRDPDAHDQILVIADSVQLRFCVRRAADGLCFPESLIFLLAAIELSIPGGVKVHTIALVGDKEGNGSMGFAGGTLGVSIDIQPQLLPAVIEMLDLQTESVDLAIVLNRKFYNTAGIQGLECKVANGITHIGFRITKIFTKAGGYQFFRVTKGKLLHRI